MIRRKFSLLLFAVMLSPATLLADESSESGIKPDRWSKSQVIIKKDMPGIPEDMLRPGSFTQSGSGYAGPRKSKKYYPSGKQIQQRRRAKRAQKERKKLASGQQNTVIRVRGSSCGVGGSVISRSRARSNRPIVRSRSRIFRRRGRR